MSLHTQKLLVHQWKKTLSVQELERLVKNSVQELDVGVVVDVELNSTGWQGWFPLMVLRTQSWHFVMAKLVMSALLPTVQRRPNWGIKMEWLMMMMLDSQSWIKLNLCEIQCDLRKKMV